MRTKFAAAALTLAVGIGGMTMAPAAMAGTASSTHRTATVQAAGFYAGGTWVLYQSRGGSVVTLNLTQDSGGRLYGSASTPGMVGTLEVGAAVNGTSLEFIIDWSNGARGRYTGTLGSDRRLSGYTYDLNNPSSGSPWATTRTF
jgi:hypothetical protein